MIYVLYGQPGAGKTTLGKWLAEYLDTPFIIDGDEFRGMFKNIDYGFGGRKKNIRAANAVATYLNKKGKSGIWTAIYCRKGRNEIRGLSVDRQTHVVVSLVNPYKQFRDELKEDNENQVFEVLLTSNRALRKKYHVKDFEIGNPDLTINTDGAVEESFEALLRELG